MPRLPPVDISPHARLRARFCPAVICSVLIFLQSHSSSSATSCARPVIVPWPISERATRITQLSSGRTTTQALSSTGIAPWADARGRLNASARPPPAAAESIMNLRRARLVFMSDLLLASRQVDCRANALVGAAAADVAHRLVDLLIGRLGFFPQQRCRRHDLSRLAVAALRHVERRPGLLHRVRGAA